MLDESKDTLLPENLTVDELSALFAEKTGVVLPKDDPAWCFVIVAQAFLNAEVKQQQRLLNAMKALLEKQTEVHVQAVSDVRKQVEEQVNVLSQTLSGLAVQGVQDVAARFSEGMGAGRFALYLCTAIIALSALINVAAFLLRAGTV